jgi:hypothetical protein
MKNPSGKNCSDEDKASDNKKQDGISSSSSSSSESDDEVPLMNLKKVKSCRCTVKPAHTVTSIKQSPVFKGHF